MDRRTFIRGVGVSALALGTAGCVDLVIEGDVEARSDPATISDDALSEAGFSLAGMDARTIDEEVDLEATTVDVFIESWVSTFEPDDLEVSVDPDAVDVTVDNESADVADVGSDALDVDDGFTDETFIVGVLTTPSETIAGQELNPISRLEDDEIIDHLEDEFGEGSVTNVEDVESFEVTTLGDDLEVGVFEADLEYDDHDDEIRIYTGEISHEDDIIMPLVGHHVAVEGEETVRTLLADLEHPVDPV